MNGKLRILGAALVWLMVSLNTWAEEFIVDFNRPNTYAAVFEAGLRPRHTIEQETSTVEVRPAAAVGFQLLHWNIPPVKAVWDFNVGKNKQLYSIRGVVSDAWTKEEALRTVTPLELAFGGDASTIAKMKAWIEGYPESSINGDTWGRKVFSEDKKISVAYYFRHSMQPARPLSMSVSIGLGFPPGEIGFHEGILEPPPGFEHIDISKVWLDSETTSLPPKDPLVPEAEPSPSRTSAVSLFGPRNRWWWALGFVVLAVVARVVWRRKHGGLR